jgi:glutaminyl-tRNA synthetase
VLDPVKLVITNWDALMGAGKLDDCSAPVHPHDEARGTRHFKFGKELWIERTDYEEVPPKGYNRLFPGNKVRLKYGHVIECKGATKDAGGNVTEVQAELIPDTKSGTPGASAIKVKGVITWVAVADALKAEVRLYDRLFSVPQPDTTEKDFLEELNPDSLKVVTAYVEPSLASAKGDEKFQFERHGYFVADLKDHFPLPPNGGEGKPVFNRVAGMKDSWGK